MHPPDRKERSAADTREKGTKHTEISLGNVLWPESQMKTMYPHMPTGYRRHYRKDAIGTSQPAWTSMIASLMGCHLRYRPHWNEGGRD
jgi:hypothetical protein